MLGRKINKVELDFSSSIFIKMANTKLYFFLFWAISQYSVAQTTSHSLFLGINNHFYKHLNYVNPISFNKIEQSLFCEYSFELIPKITNTILAMATSYRNNKFKYSINDQNSFPTTVDFFIYSRPQVGLDLNIGHQVRLSEKTNLKYHLGLGMLISTNEIFRGFEEGEIDGVVYPDKYIDSVRYTLINIHENTISPTILCSINLEKKLTKQLLIIFKLKIETGIVDSQTQFFAFEYFSKHGRTTEFEYYTTNNTSIIFTTGIKFSNNLFKKRG